MQYLKTNCLSTSLGDENLWRISLALTIAGSYSYGGTGRSEEGGREYHYSGAREAVKRILKLYSSADKAKNVQSQVSYIKQKPTFQQ
jgi:hypothetical protein